MKAWESEIMWVCVSEKLCKLVYIARKPDKITTHTALYTLSELVFMQVSNILQKKKKKKNIMIFNNSSMICNKMRSMVHSKCFLDNTFHAFCECKMSDKFKVLLPKERSDSETSRQ